MDVTVTETVSRTRRYTVTGVNSAEAGTAKVIALTDAERAAAVAGTEIGATDVTPLAEGQSDNENYSAVSA